MTEFEIGIIITIGAGIVSFFVRDLFWSKAQKNQDKIDSDLAATVNKNTERIVELEKNVALYGLLSKNNQEEITELKSLFTESNKGVQQLVKILETVNENIRIQHNDIRTQNAELKQVMDQCNLMMRETNTINKELLGYLKSR